MATEFPGHGFVGGQPYKMEYDRVVSRLGFPEAGGEMTDETCKLCKDQGKLNPQAACDIMTANTHVSKERTEQAKDPEKAKKVAEILANMKAEIIALKKKPAAVPDPGLDVGNPMAGIGNIQGIAYQVAPPPPPPPDQAVLARAAQEAAARAAEKELRDQFFKEMDNYIQQGFIQGRKK